MNEEAKLSGYRDASTSMLWPYEDPDIVLKVKSLWNDVKPLYLQLHAYVRKKLYAFYGNKANMDSVGPLPAHLLGNLWAQSWINIYNNTQPFPEVALPTITGVLNKKVLFINL